jgi:hypothetical protein
LGLEVITGIPNNAISAAKCLLICVRVGLRLFLFADVGLKSVRSSFLLGFMPLGSIYQFLKSFFAPPTCMTNSLLIVPFNSVQKESNADFTSASRVV